MNCLWVDACIGKGTQYQTIALYKRGIYYWTNRKRRKCETSSPKYEPQFSVAGIHPTSESRHIFAYNYDQYICRNVTRKIHFYTPTPLWHFIKGENVRILWENDSKTLTIIHFNTVTILFNRYYVPNKQLLFDLYNNAVMWRLYRNVTTLYKHIMAIH